MSAPDHAPCSSKRFFLHRWGRPHMSMITVSPSQFRDEDLLDISAKALAIDRSVDDAGRGEAVATQSRQEGEGPPFAEGRFGDEALTSGASAVGARHVGFGPGLVDEDQALGINRRLTRLPPLTPPGDVPAGPVRRREGFF
jgi:hypothetical protein